MLFFRETEHLIVTKTRVMIPYNIQVREKVTSTHMREKVMSTQMRE